MPEITVSQCSVKDIVEADNIAALLDEYAEECAIAGLPHPKARIDLYYQLEASGVFYVAAAKLDDRLIGFITAIVPILPHYGVGVAVSESFFVAREARHTGAGMRLLDIAERHALSKGACGILVSAPFGGRLAEILPRKGYVEASRVFFRKL